MKSNYLLIFIVSLLFISGCSSEINLKEGSKIGLSEEVASAKSDQPSLLSEEEAKELLHSLYSEMYEGLEAFQADYYDEFNEKREKQVALDMANNHLSKMTTEKFREQQLEFLTEVYTCECGGYFVPGAKGIRYNVENIEEDTVVISHLVLADLYSLTEAVTVITTIKNVNDEWLLDGWEKIVHTKEGPSLELTFEDIKEHNLTSEYSDLNGEYLDTMIQNEEEWIIINNSDFGPFAINTHTSEINVQIAVHYLEEEQELEEALTDPSLEDTVSIEDMLIETAKNYFDEIGGDSSQLTLYDPAWDYEWSGSTYFSMPFSDGMRVTTIYGDENGNIYSEFLNENGELDLIPLN